ncbi:hypothetical protein WJX79_001536 [Trebouxia sp. C0005]
MALWLYWLFYAAALGTATCYAAYKAALVQRTLAAVARRGLRGLVHDITDDSKGCTVTRTESGVRLEHATISDRTLGRIDNLYMSITDITVHLLEVSLPTMSRPLTLTLSGVTVELMQRTLPQYSKPNALAAMEQAVSHQINNTKLLAVEKLLWGHTPKKPGEGMQGFGSRMRARAAHRLLVIAAQYISFDATNIQLVYKQAGMPGPRPTADSPLQGMDAVCLNVRKLSLNPLEAPKLQAQQAGSDPASPGAQFPRRQTNPLYNDHQDSHTNGHPNHKQPSRAPEPTSRQQWRPQVDVAGNSEVWWKHAGSNVRRECHFISRRQVPLSALEQRRKARLEYHELYTRTHCRLPTFKNPNRSWWKWVQAADASDKAALQRLEDRLSMEEIAHFRAFVAAQSSKLLIKSETHLQHAVDAVDAVVANLGPLPQGCGGSPAPF